MVSLAASPDLADRPLRLGILGLNEGNGHPYSFSAIVNGYDEAGMAEAGWPVIYNYLRQRDPSEFGFADVQVTHVWTQDPDETARIARASKVPHAVADPAEMIGQVDAVLLCRDDVETHRPLATPFLEAGLPVFIDKPLAVTVEDLRYFKPYLESGQLMSCAAMRYAKELDFAAAGAELEQVKLVRGANVLNFERYGVHMLEGVFRVIPCHVRRVWALPGAPYEAVVLEQEEGHPLIQIDSLGLTVKVFQFDFFGTTGRTHAEAGDNFSMFRRLIWHFIQQVRTGQPAIPPEHTLRIMKILIAATHSRAENRPVELSEIVL